MAKLRNIKLEIKHMINRPLKSFLFFLNIFILMLFGSLSSAFATSIMVSPTSMTVDNGNIFSIDILAKDITDLYAFQFDIGFDPTVISVVSVTEGAFLPSGGPTFFVPGTIDNVAGTIEVNTDTLLSAVPGVTGGGILETIEFTAIVSGNSNITISNVAMLDSSLNDITANIENGSVTVRQNSVPEPSTIFLLLGGLLLGFVKRPFAFFGRLVSVVIPRD
jgi:hypothetical protein